MGYSGEESAPPPGITQTKLMAYIYDSISFISTTVKQTGARNPMIIIWIGMKIRKRSFDWSLSPDGHDGRDERSQTNPTKLSFLD